MDNWICTTVAQPGGTPRSTASRSPKHPQNQPARSPPKTTARTHWFSASGTPAVPPRRRSLYTEPRHRSRRSPTTQVHHPTAPPPLTHRSGASHHAGPGHPPRPRSPADGAAPPAPAMPPRVRCGGRGGGGAVGAARRDALDAAGEGGGVPVAAGLGGGVAAAAAQARGGHLAAGGLPAGLVVRDVRARGARAAGPRRRAARRVLRGVGRGHGHRGGAPHVPDHDQHPGRRPRRDRRQRLPLGRLDPRLDRRGEPTRRRPQQVHVPLRPRRHAHGREDRPVPHRLRHGPEDGEQPVPGLRVHELPGARDGRLPRQHRAARQGARRRRAGAHLRHHRRRREAPRDGLQPHRGAAAAARPGGRHARHRRHDAQADHHARAPHARRQRHGPVRAFRVCGPAPRRVHRAGLHRHRRVPRQAVEAGGAGGRALQRRAAGPGLRLRARAEDAARGGEGGRQGQEGRAQEGQVQLDL
ncbi:hypothetical protein VPH35_062113 [Triticum aestivum]